MSIEYHADSVILGVVSFSLSAIGFLSEISGKNVPSKESFPQIFMIKENKCQLFVQKERKVTYFGESEEASRC